MDEQHGDSEVPATIGATGNDMAGVDVMGHEPDLADLGLSGSGAGPLAGSQLSGEMLSGGDGPPPEENDGTTG